MQVQGKYDAKSFLTEKTFPTAKTFLTEQMTRAQGLRLKRLSEEAYQPAQYARDLSSSEAARRIQVLEAEIELADSF
jgi:hypothetical protein